MDRSAFADLAARAFNAGNYGLTSTQPEVFLDDLDEGRIHPDALVPCERDGALVGVAYLFVQEPARPWGLRLAIEPEHADPESIERELIAGMAARCRALDLMVVEVAFEIPEARQASLRDAGFVLTHTEEHKNELLDAISVLQKWVFYPRGGR